MEKISRELGLMEKYQVSKQTTNVYGTLCLTANLKLNEGSVNSVDYLKSILYPALSSISKKIAHLSLAVIDINTPTPKFLQIPTIDLNKLITIDSSSEYTTTTPTTSENSTSPPHVVNKTIQDELSKDFDLNDRTSPLWRLRVITNTSNSYFTIIFVVHHIISDGISTFILMKELLDTINNQQLNLKQPLQYQDNQIVNLDDSNLVVGEPLDKRTPHHPTTWDLLPVIVKHFLVPNFLKKYFTTSFWAGDQPAVKEMHNTRMLQFSFDNIPTLLAKCRENKTTPHAFIYVATILATLKVFGSGNNSNQDGPLTLLTQTPFSARKFCVPPVSDSEVGNFVAGIDRTKQYNYATLSEASNFWEECRSYKRDLQQSMVYGVKSTNMLKFVGEFPKAWNDFWLNRLSLPMGRIASFELSDLGNVDFSYRPQSNESHDHGSGSSDSSSSSAQPCVQFISPIYAQSCNVVGSAFNINTITSNNTLSGTITWHLSAITDDHANQVIEHIKEVLDKFSK